MAEMDERDMITPLQSSTIRKLAMGMIIHAITVLGVVTGKVFDIEFVEKLVDSGYIVVVNAVAFWLEYKAIEGRMKATKVVGGSLAEKLRNK